MAETAILEEPIKPTPDSRVMSAMLGQTGEVSKIDNEVKYITDKFTPDSLEDKSLTEKNVNSYLKLAEQAGNPDLFELTKVRAYYNNIFPSIPEGMEKNAYGNAIASIEKKMEEGESGANEFADKYSKYKKHYESLVNKSADSELSAINWDEEAERIQSLGFSKELVDSYSYEQDMLRLIGTGDPTSIPGVDNGWLRVYYNVHPDKASWPKAHESFRALRSSVVQDYNRTHEDNIGPENLEQVDKLLTVRNTYVKGETK
jgi:hypothetical protein